MENSGNETLRWPTNLDRAAIEQRLAQSRQAASAAGLAEVAAALDDIENKKAGEIAKGVMQALTLLEGKPEQRALTLHLEMVALNLKNLKIA